MGLKKQVVTDAGITNPSTLNQEVEEGKFVSAPRSSYHIDGNINLNFTDASNRNKKILEKGTRKLNIADGDVRPGHAS